jgi:formylmethanofuran dehydrogenase subunit B
VQLVFWGADASSTHPRLQSRYAAESTVRAISVDCQPGRDIDLIRSQRRALKGKPCEKSAHLLLQTFQEAKGGIILAGSGLARQGRAALQELCCLCADLEDGGWGRWEILPLLEGTNSLGAIQALMAVCGFPGSACFTPNRAEFSPLDWSAEHVLLHHWTDLLIWVGAESWLSPTALSKMDAIPNIVVSSRPPDWSPTAWLPVRQFGIDAEGTALRLDGAPVNFTPAFERPGWDMPAVLERLGAP